MQLEHLRSVFEHEGPKLTVYLERRSPGEDAAEQVRKRWQALRREAADAGADAELLDAAEQALVEHKAGEVQADGRVLVAATDADGSRVLLDEHWDAALGSGDACHVSSLPETSAMVRAELGAIRLLVVIANQLGAQIRYEVAPADHPPEHTDADVVEGDSIEGAHKPREGALSHRRIQQRADEAVKHNAKQIVEHVHSVLPRWRPRILALAGETKGRAAIRAELDHELEAMTVDISHGGVDDEAAESALAEELADVAAAAATRARQDSSEQFDHARAHGLAVDGVSAVRGALRMGAVGTLLLAPVPQSEQEAQLLQAAAETSAEVGMVAAGTQLQEGVGAVLRFPIDELNA